VSLRPRKARRRRASERRRWVIRGVYVYVYIYINLNLYIYIYINSIRFAQAEEGAATARERSAAAAREAAEREAAAAEERAEQAERARGEADARLAAAGETIASRSCRI